MISAKFREPACPRSILGDAKVHSHVRISLLNAQELQQEPHFIKFDQLGTPVRRDELIQCEELADDFVHVIANGVQLGFIQSSNRQAERRPDASFTVHGGFL